MPGSLEDKGKPPLAGFPKQSELGGEGVGVLPPLQDRAAQRTGIPTLSFNPEPKSPNHMEGSGTVG